MAHHHFSERPDEQVKLCTEIMSEARRNPEIARISAAFDADVKKWLIDLLRAGAERGDIAARSSISTPSSTMLMIIADGVWWRRALDPNFDAKALLPIFMDITRHMLRSRTANRVRAKEECPMKASRITAVGLVAAAGLWIASGHFLPHESAESRAVRAQRRRRRRSCSASRSSRRKVVAAQPASSCSPAAPRPTSA